MKFTILKIYKSWSDKQRCMFVPLTVKVQMETGEILKTQLAPHINLYDEDLSNQIIEAVTEKYKDYQIEKLVSDRIEKIKSEVPKSSFWKGKVLNIKEEPQ